MEPAARPRSAAQPRQPRRSDANLTAPAPTPRAAWPLLARFPARPTTCDRVGAPTTPDRGLRPPSVQGRPALASEMRLTGVSAVEQTRTRPDLDVALVFRSMRRNATVFREPQPPIPVFDRNRSCSSPPAGGERRPGARVAASARCGGGLRGRPREAAASSRRLASRCSETSAPKPIDGRSFGFEGGKLPSEGSPRAAHHRTRIRALEAQEAAPAPWPPWRASGSPPSGRHKPRTINRGWRPVR